MAAQGWASPLAINRGRPLLLRNDTQTTNRFLSIRLRGPAPACFAAKVEVLAGQRRRIRWWGADGEISTESDVPAGRVEIIHPNVDAPSAQVAGRTVPSGLSAD